MTLDLYNYVIEQLPPTPSRFHYIFNLRDLSRVTEGLLLATPTNFTTSAQFVRLWRNEVLRVFHDRLISSEDKQVRQQHCLHVLHRPGHVCNNCSMPSVPCWCRVYFHS